MRLMFWKSEPEPEPEKLYIPLDHIEKVLELSDAYNALPAGQDKVIAFRLWRKIFVALNISMDVDEVYSLNVQNAIKPFITRKIS